MTTAIQRVLARRARQGHRHDVVFAFYGILTLCSLAGAVVGAIILDRARVVWNALRLRGAR